MVKLWLNEKLVYGYNLKNYVIYNHYKQMNGRMIWVL